MEARSTKNTYGDALCIFLNAKSGGNDPEPKQIPQVLQAIEFDKDHDALRLRVDQLRESRNLTHEEFVELASLDQARYQDWLCGNAELDFDIAARISISFDVSLKWLIGAVDGKL